MRRSARIFFLYTFAFLACFFFVTPSLAQAQNGYTQTSNNPYQNLNTNPDVPLTQRTAVDSLFINIMASMICQLSGIDVMAIKTNQQAQISSTIPRKCLGLDKTSGKIGYVENGEGAIGIMGSSIAMLYQPPAHMSDYTNYLAQGFGLVPKTYAQATGFQSLQPLIGVWSVFRNVTYIFFVLAFVIIGILIMLRVKIDPRTVMSIQNSIPRLVMGILMITFSYAIAGFLIDIMWAVTYTTIGIMSDAVKATDHSGEYQESQAAQHIQDYPFGFFNHVFVGQTAGIGIMGTFEFSRNVADGVGILFRSLTGSGNVGSDLKNAINVPSYLSVGNFGRDDTTDKEDSSCGWNPICGVGKLVGSVVSGVVGNLVSAVFHVLFGIISWVVALLAFLVILIAVIVTLFRIWFTLLRAYIVILLAIVWAPFWILMGMVPGSGINFAQWLRHTTAHLVLFPVTIIMFLMARVFIQAFEPAFLHGNPGEIFLPPLIGNANMPEALGPLIAFAVLMYVPHILNIVRDALKTAPGKYANATGQGFGAGAGVLKGGVGAGMAYSEKIKGPGDTGGKEAIFKRLLGG